MSYFDPEEKKTTEEKINTEGKRGKKKEKGSLHRPKAQGGVEV
jgi:hypothetical protein